MELLPPRSTLTFMGAALAVTFRRLVKGPRRPRWSWMYETMVRFMKADTKRVSALPPPAQRAHMERLPAPPSGVFEKVRREPVDAGGVTGEWFVPPEAVPGAAAIYLHGGSYVFGSTRTHGDLIARIALASGVRVLGLNYRLAPEHPFPAAIDDARAAWRWLRGEGLSPSRVVLSGDSAGGGLAVATMLSLRDAGEPLPGGAVLLSPWVDLTCSGESAVTNEPWDWGDKPMLIDWARHYVAGNDAGNPLISPTHATLKGLPPLFIQVGTAELVRDDVLAFAEKAKAAGVPVEVDVWGDMVHLFQSFGPMFPESQQATERLGREIRARTAGDAGGRRAAG